MTSTTPELAECGRPITWEDFEATRRELAPSLWERVADDALRLLREQEMRDAAEDTNDR